MINETFNEDEKRNEEPEFISLDTLKVHKMNMRLVPKDDPEAFVNEWAISGGENYPDPEDELTEEDLHRINFYEPD